MIWAVTGITLKTIFFEDLAEWLGLSFYLSLGWFGIFSTILLTRRHGFGFVKPLLLGGLVYTCGGIMEFLGWPMILPGIIHPHELFHLAVLAGAILHWRFVWQFAKGDNCGGDSAFLKSYNRSTDVRLLRKVTENGYESPADTNAAPNDVASIRTGGATSAGSAN